MKHHLIERGSLRIGAREELGNEDLGKLWRIESGTMRIDVIAEDGRSHFVRLAIVGDILGMEGVAGVTERLVIRALTKVVLSPVKLAEEGQLMPLALESLARAHQRCRDVVSLRTGAVEDRVKRLLRMLSSRETPEGDSLVCSLPSLGNMAEIIHATPESVCRVLAAMRKQHLLQKTTMSNIRSKGLDFHKHRIVAHALAA
ncbi:hypothetical protein RF679_06340 [Undibacterium cyanobacteriorum]|uniref:HTH crp-type domain-containing protein n=1 Tax=Undibacterium cyanobacteriorum TaxID=3073561 RepID=A0ABY9RL17_9BURK|nr:hypothetical protein [Undibacterium sp. 20NA77.5]WMW81899.1 hypothetical protein RF679_06340 [Undibacterium sp. 20NA77.5]